MAVERTNILKESNATPGSTFSISSITPIANRLYLLAVIVRNGSSVNPADFTATGGGLTWVKITSTLYDNSSTSRRRLVVFRGMSQAPTSGAITIDCGAESNSGIITILDEFANVDISGTNGSGAIVQSAANQATSGATSLTVTLAAFSSTDNATWGVFGNPDQPTTISPGGGFTGDGNTTGTNANVNAYMLAEFNAGNDTSVDATQGASLEMGGVAVEIKYANPIHLLGSLGAGR